MEVCGVGPRLGVSRATGVTLHMPGGLRAGPFAPSVSGRQQASNGFGGVAVARPPVPQDRAHEGARLFGPDGVQGSRIVGVEHVRDVYECVVLSVVRHVNPPAFLFAEF
jgi:hypothetical protein